MPGKTFLSTVAASDPLTVGKSAASTSGGSSKRLKIIPPRGAAERLVRGRRDDVGVRERRRVDAGSDEAGDVRHVDEEEGADRMGDVGHPLEVPEPRIGRGATDDELRAHLAGLRLHRVVVDPLGVLTHAVRVDLVQPPAEVELHPVGEVAAVGQVHAHHPVAGLEDAEIGRHVRLGAGVGLDVDVLGAGVEREGTLLREPLGHVDVLAAAVVALARKALGVLVRQPRTLGFEHGGRHVVLAGDQLDLVVLAPALAEHRLPQDGIDLGETLQREAVRARDRHAVAVLPAVPGRPSRRRAPLDAAAYLPTNEVPRAALSRSGGPFR